jgi:ABC-type multidrug transport system fused ATPase/permease subunit
LAVGGLIADYFRAYRNRWVIGTLLTLASTSLGLVTPWLLRQAIDSFSSPEGARLEQFALAIVAVALLEAGCRFLARLVITGASRWVEYDLRNR